MEILSSPSDRWLWLDLGARDVRDGMEYIPYNDEIVTMGGEYLYVDSLGQVTFVFRSSNRTRAALAINQHLTIGPSASPTKTGHAYPIYRSPWIAAA